MEPCVDTDIQKFLIDSLKEAIHTEGLTASELISLLQELQRVACSPQISELEALRKDVEVLKQWKQAQELRNQVRLPIGREPLGSKLG